MVESPGAGKSVWDDWGVVAHRCGGARAPENSLAGLEKAAAAGLGMVEFDVMLSADGVPVVIHDDTLDRTTFATGPVAKRTAAALAGLAINRGWSGRFSRECVPTLAQALSACRRLGLVPNIEIKPAPGMDCETGRAVAIEAVTAWSGSGDRPLISSFSEPALAVARALVPGWPAALLVERVPPDWRHRMDRLGVSSLHCHFGQTDWAWLEAARGSGLAVRCYTVDDPRLALRLKALGVRGVFSDCLDREARIDPAAGVGAPAGSV